VKETGRFRMSTTVIAWKTPAIHCRGSDPPGRLDPAERPNADLAVEVSSGSIPSSSEPWKAVIPVRSAAKSFQRGAKISLLPDSDYRRVSLDSLRNAFTL